MLTSHEAREWGNTGSKNGRNCSDLLMSVHLHLMGFLLLADIKAVSAPSATLTSPYAPDWREAQLGCLWSESTYVEGGTPEDGWQYSFSQYSLQGDEGCSLVPALMLHTVFKPQLKVTSANDGSLPLPSGYRVHTLLAEKYPPFSFLFFLCLKSISQYSTNQQWQPPFDCSLL